MKASRPNACKCNVNLFRFVIVLFSKVVRQWGICNIFFYIIYSIYDTILSASSTYLQAPVTFPAGTTYVPAGPFCSYLFPSCRTLLQLPVPFLQLHVPFLQLPVPFLQDPSAGPSCRTLLQLPVAFLQVLVAFLQVLVAFLQVPVAFLQVPVAFLQEPCPQDPPAGPSCSKQNWPAGTFCFLQEAKKSHSTLKWSTEESCLGGAATGESSCSEGYSGPLCAVCEEGTILYDTRHAEIWSMYMRRSRQHRTTAFPSQPEICFTIYAKSFSILEGCRHDFSLRFVFHHLVSSQYYIW